MMRVKLSRDTIQAVAMVSMLLDHAAVSFLEPGSSAYIWLRAVGRLAYPVFMVLFMDGCARSSTPAVKRFSGLILAGLAAEPFFDYMIAGSFVHMGHQNVLIAWALSLAFLYAVNNISRDASPSGTVFATAFVIMYAFGLCAVCAWLAVDYGLAHAACTIGCWAVSSRHKGRAAIRWMAWVTCACVGILYIEPACLLAVPLLYAYDPDDPGARFLPKGACRWFYPAHLAVYAVIRMTAGI